VRQPGFGRDGEYTRRTLAEAEDSSAASGGIGPAYLIAGTDEAKIDAAVARLRSRADTEGGPGALETFSPAPGSSAAPDAEALAAAVPALSLTAEHRYLLAEGVERWSAKQADPVIEALAALPPQTTVVLVARESPPKLTAPKRLADAVEKAGGEVIGYAAPRARDLPRWLAEEARRRGFELEAPAAKLLIERLGEGTMRLATELDRLSVWAKPSGTVTRADLEAMIADTSEEAAWAMSDAIIDQDPAAAVAAAERLAEQGESVTPLIYQAAKRLREANLALDALEAGTPPKEVERSLPMHPYAAKLLVGRVRGQSSAQLRAAACAIADLEWWTRGGSDYPDRVALTLAVRRAAGVRD
jgi:DNA polymerase III subunit delta